MEITLTVPANQVENCEVILFEETGRGTYKLEPETGPLQDRQQIRGFLPRDEAFRRRFIRLKNRIAAHFCFFPEEPAPGWELRLIPAENWQENWKRNFKPLKITPTLVICPTWRNTGQKEGRRSCDSIPGRLSEQEDTPAPGCV